VDSASWSVGRAGCTHCVRLVADGALHVPAATVGDDFAVYRQALDSAADSALANVMREAAASSQIYITYSER